ncbi:PAS domain S-box protein [Oceanidesulfovibrio marinus]|nr:PAS domain S-box protein [Oceanidesulfovibrio marinus]
MLSTNDFSVRFPVQAFRATFDGRIVCANTNLVRLLGYDAPEELYLAMSNGYLEQCYPRPGLRDLLFQKLRSHGQVDGFEIPMRRKNGSVFWAAVHASAVSGPHDGDAVVEGFLLDITAKHSMQEVIQSSRDTVRNLLDSMESHSIMLHEGGTVLAVNKAFASWLNLSFHQVVGANIFHTDTVVRLGSELLEGIENVLCSGMEANVLETSGGEAFSTDIRPVFNGDGMLRHLVVKRYDLSKHRALREALQESETRYNSLFSQAGDAIFIHDYQGRILDVNPAAALLLESSRETLINENLSTFLEKGTSIQSHLNEDYSRAPLQQAFEVVCITSSKRRVCLELTARPVDYHGRRCILCVGRDVSRRKDVERKLYEAKRAAEENLRLKDEFLANVTHELRTPMSSILGLSELGLLKNEASDPKTYLKKIHAVSDQLLQLVNSILDLSVLEAGKLALEDETFHFDEIVGTVIDTLQYQADQAGIQLSAEVDPDLVGFYQGDAPRLRQVLLNLTANALKYTNEGQVAVSVRPARSSALAQGEGLVPIVVEVSDTGIGIAADQIEFVFERFRRLPQEGAKRIRGSGIGLAVCKRLVDLMGGSISVRSELGVGSTFSVTVPVRRVEEMPAAATGSVPFVSRRPLRILLAEDDRINLKMYSEILEEGGHTVDCVLDGQQAVESFMRADYDLILLDVNMPVCDGYGAAKRIRSLEPIRQKRTPILVMSALPEHRIVGECAVHGIDGYIPKPVTMQDLLQTIDAHSSGESVGEAAKDECVTGERIVDFSRLQEQFDGKEQRIRSVCNSFVQNAPRYIEEMEEALAEWDGERLYRVSHSFSSVAKVFGSATAVEVCHDVMKAAKSCDWKSVDACLLNVRDVVNDMCRVIQVKIDSAL